MNPDQINLHYSDCVLIKILDYSDFQKKFHFFEISDFKCVFKTSYIITHLTNFFCLICNDYIINIKKNDSIIVDEKARFFKNLI